MDSRLSLHSSFQNVDLFNNVHRLVQQYSVKLKAGHSAHLYISVRLFYLEDIITVWLSTVCLGFIAFTTIGYGDLSPQTPAGRSVFVVWALIGVGAMSVFISGQYGLFYYWLSFADTHYSDYNSHWSPLIASS